MLVAPVLIYGAYKYYHGAKTVPSSKLADDLEVATQSIMASMLEEFCNEVVDYAKASMLPSRGHAPKGQPPAVHKGKLRDSITYDTHGDLTAEIGQTAFGANIAGTLEETHPFMQPALEEISKQFELKYQ